MSSDLNSKKITFRNFPNKIYFVYLVMAVIFYFGGTSYVNDSEEIDLERFRVENIDEIQNALKTVIMIMLGAIITIVILYLNRNHSFLKDYIDKQGDIEELRIRITKNNKHVKDDIKKILKEHIPLFQEKLEFYQQTPTTILFMSFVLIAASGYFLFEIYQNEGNEELKEFVLTIITLISMACMIGLQWWLFEIMLSYRLDTYRLLVSDIAKMKASLQK